MAERVIGWAREHPDAAAVLGLTALAAAVRAWPLAAVKFSFEDAYFYIELARSLSRGRWELLGEFHTKYLPGYPGAIGVMHGLLLGTADWFRSAQAVSFAASAAVPGFCYALTHSITGERAGAAAAGLLAALNAHLTVMAGVPWSESLFALQAVMVVGLAARYPEAMGAVAGWAALTRHEGWFLAGAFALAMADPRSGPRRWRPAAGLAIMVAVAGSWWIYAHSRTGHWLWDIYAAEEAERKGSLGRAGPGFLLLSFPVAGHLTTLLALPGLLLAARKRAAWPAIWFLFAYAGLHGWWLFRDERYFAPLVPAVCALGGVGAGWAAGLMRRPRAAVAAGLAAGLAHLLGFAPGLVREERSRNRGYYEAIGYLRERPGDFTVIAYEALMVGYYTGRPVIPFGDIGAERWKDRLAEMFVNYGARYILWSDYYPSDLAKEELGSPDPMWVRGKVTIAGREREVVLNLELAREVRWVSWEAEPGWVRPWRKMRPYDSVAYVFTIELDQP